MGAIPVCGWTFTQPQSFTGSGNVPNEVLPISSCLGNENNSVWYTFTTQTAGNVNFTITPNNPTNDYDWAVFNLTSASCVDIRTDPSLVVSCNFSATPGPTGANNGPFPLNEPVIPVQAGETYVLLITNFSPANQSGYTLDFSASTAQIFDNVPPALQAIRQPIACNTDTLLLSFSENVGCAQVNPGTFTVTGPDGVHTLTWVYGADCAAGGASSSEYTLHVAPPLTVNGQYTVTLNTPVNDLCGNTLFPATAVPLTFNYAGLIVDSTFSTLADCLQNNGSAGIAVSGGAPPLAYFWAPGGQTTPVAGNLFAGDYTVTVSDQNHCTVTETVTVSNPVNFTVSFSQQPDTCGKGNGSVTVTAAGTSGPFTYLWDVPSGAQQQTRTQLHANDVLSVTVTDADGCVLHDTVTIGNVLNDSLQAVFSATPNPVDILFPQTKLVNESIHYATYKWVAPGQTISNSPNLVLTLPDWGDYPVQLYVYDVNGCSDMAEEVITVRGDVYYYIPNAFTPDENNLNETWQPRGVGFDRASYQMTIFDRWQNIVYQSKDADTGWNGRDARGQLCPPDTYVYKITLEGYEGYLPVFTGQVNLLR